MLPSYNERIKSTSQITRPISQSIKSQPKQAWTCGVGKCKQHDFYSKIAQRLLMRIPYLKSVYSLLAQQIEDIMVRDFTLGHHQILD